MKSCAPPPWSQRGGTSVATRGREPLISYSFHEFHMVQYTATIKKPSKNNEKIMKRDTRGRVPMHFYHDTKLQWQLLRL